MPAIRNTKKTLVERLLLKQESVKDKLLLERIRMNPTPSIKLYDKLIEADSVKTLNLTVEYTFQLEAYI